MPSTTDARWLTTKEAAAILRVHPKHVYRLLKQGLPASRVGGQWRFLASEIQSWSRDGRLLPGHEEQQLSTSRAPSLIAARDEPAVEHLLHLVRSGPKPWIGRVGAFAGVEAVLDGSVMACAITGDLPETPPVLLARVHLAHVEYGLASLPGEAAASCSSLGRHKVRLASWPPGSDLRAVLDGVLAREGIDSRRCHAHSVEITSHADAIAAVVSRRADLAWTSAAWAARFGMQFLPLASRSLALIVRAASLGDPNFVRCWEVMQSQAFRDAVRALPGHDPGRAGEIGYLPRSSDESLAHTRPAESPSGRTRSRPTGRGKRVGLRCAFITRGHGQDASELMLRVVRALQKRGLVLCGCVQVPRRSRGRLSGYDLVRVGHAGSLPLARRETSQKSGFAPFVFRDETFQAARGWINEDAGDARIAVIDSLGALESKGAGHFEAIAAALRASAPGFVIASARRDLLPALLDRLGIPRAAALLVDTPCDATAEKRFVQAIARSSGA